MVEFNHLCQQLIVTVPLNEVSSAHEGAMFAGATFVMPEIEIGEIDRLAEGQAGEASIFVQVVHNGLGGENLGIGAGDNLFSLRVNPVDKSLGVTLRAHLLHVDLGLQIVGSMGTDRCGEVPAQAV